MNVYKGLLRCKRGCGGFVLVFLLLTGMVGFKSWNRFKVLQRLDQAQELRVNEEYEAAIVALDEVQTKVLTEKLRLEVETQLAKNKQLREEKLIYYQGVEEAKSGTWEKALDIWAKITEVSLYYSKVKVEKEIAHEKPDGEMVQLISYKHALDPTWGKLLDFLRKDAADDKRYNLESFVCTGFAELLHNNAERAGIKTAYVGIDFAAGPGHAINAFETTDRGLVYVDVTGPGFSRSRDDFLNQGGLECEWDKIAYVIEGEIYGTISISYLDLVPNGEGVYKDYIGLWMDVEDRFENLEGKIKIYNDISAEYKKKNVAYESDRESYEKELGEYSQKKTETQSLINKEQEDRRKALDVKLAYWEEKKAEYEKELADYNARVELYNSKGEGEITEFQQEQKDLDNAQEGLKQELEELKKEYDSLNKEMEKKVEGENEKLERLKETYDKTRAGLEEQGESLNMRSDELKILSEELSGEFGDLKLREKELGICYWKPMEKVTKISVFW